MDYKILIWIFDNHDDFQPRKKKFLEGSQQVSPSAASASQRDRKHAASAASSQSAGGDVGDPLVRLVVVGLLQGLSDPVPSVRDHLFAFWDDENRLSGKIEERLQQLLTTLFQPETVELWLSYATRLLMYPMRRSSDFNRALSDKALDECKFTPMNLNLSGVTRSAGMTPLFSASLSQPFTMGASGDNAQISGQDADGDTAMSDAGGYVLNSQAAGLNFHATPSLMSMNTQQLMAWNLSQASQNEHLYFKNQPAASQQPVMGSFEAFSGDPRQRALRKRLKGKSKQRVSIKNQHRVQIGTDTVSLRFAGSQSGGRASSMKWRQEADLKNRYQRVWQARLAEESASQVTMFRKYRKVS
jgi:hypothetical protein